MGGFVQSAIWLGKEGSNEMTMHRSENVPVITTLAKEFALFDRCVRSFYVPHLQPHTHIGCGYIRHASRLAEAASPSHCGNLSAVYMLR